MKFEIARNQARRKSPSRLIVLLIALCSLCYSFVPAHQNLPAQPRAANVTYFAHSSMNLKEFSHGRAAAGQIPPPYSRAEENARELDGRSE
ncbi:MAG: hypothetical protein DMG65_24205 [Candidatus Angelobacter sp. Gp1-AA117]|nr:MAG: hypothetical protein DMG65_24205 [Candidatus Angelobacter sp. Gp1-AA117]